MRTTIVEVEDEFSNIVRQFKKNGVIPNTLASSFLFRQQWYLHTFLPNLLAWDGGSVNNKIRDELVEALRKDSVKKMPDNLYFNFIQKKKEQNRK